jgi:hypothetical protein
VSCATPEKLTQKGWDKYNEKNYGKAEQLFSKSLKKQTYQSSAYEGLAFVNSVGYGNYRKAEYYMGQAYRLNSSSSCTYNYACFANRNGNAQKAMNLLFEIPAKGNFDYYRKLASKDSDLSSLKNDPKFIRYLSGYRRIQVEPYYGYCRDNDGIGGGENDLFMVVEHQGRIILVTNVIQNSNKAFWTSDYVVLDYPFNSEIKFFLIDEDVFKHDKYAQAKMSVAQVGEFSFDAGISGFKIRFSDTERSPYTTGTRLPPEISLAELALGTNGLYLVTQAFDLDNSFVTRLIDCTIKVGINYFVDNIVHASLLSEVYDAVRKRQGVSFYSLSISVVKNLIIRELIRRGHPVLAATIEVADYLNCVLEIKK